jgi:hypothetical protein
MRHLFQVLHPETCRDPIGVEGLGWPRVRPARGQPWDALLGKSPPKEAAPGTNRSKRPSTAQPRRALREDRPLEPCTSNRECRAGHERHE